MARDTRGTHDKSYLLDTRQAEAGERFTALSTLFDPSTFRHFETAGAGEGRRRWEVGTVGPTVPTWPAERAGPTRHVTATDIDTSWMR